MRTVLVIALTLVGCTSAAPDAFAPQARTLTPQAKAVAESGPAYRRVGRRFQLTRPMRFETKAFGTVVLTRGFRSDGSSSPIPDTEATRRAGFLHDALYAASGHLRFPDGAPRSYTRGQADETYCAQMVKLGAAAWHARANCLGTRRLPQIERRWRRLRAKRERRWRRWSGL